MDTTHLIDDTERAEHEAWADSIEAAPATLRENLGLETREASGFVCYSSPGWPVPMLNRIAVTAGDVNVDELTRAIDELARGKARAYVQVPPGGRFEQVREFVRSRLGAPVSSWAKFHRTERRVADVTTDFQIRELELEHAADFAKVVKAGFGMPEGTHPWMQALVGRPRWRAFGAFDGSKLVGVGCTFFAGGHAGPVAWLGLGVVDASFRRRGAQQALLSERTRVAFADGALAVVSETGKPKPGEDGPSFRNLSRSLGLAYTRDNFLVQRTAI